MEGQKKKIYFSKKATVVLFLLHILYFYHPPLIYSLSRLPISSLEDLSEDAPKVYDYLAKVLLDAIVAEVLPITFLLSEKLGELSTHRVTKIASMVLSGLPDEKEAFVAKLPIDFLAKVYEHIHGIVLFSGLLAAGVPKRSQALFLALPSEVRASRGAHDLAAAAIRHVVRQTTGRVRDASARYVAPSLRLVCL